MATPKGPLTPSFKTFDFFDKAVDGVRDTSLLGAFISVSSMGIMALLFLSELWAYLNVDSVTHMRVNAHHELRETLVHLHITFPHLPCEALSLEVENIRGGKGLGSVTDHAVDIRQPNKDELALVRRSLKADANVTPEGACTLSGDLTIARVGGVVHIKVPNVDRAGENTLDHYIHDLTFGHHPLDEFKHPLRGASVDAPLGTARVAYTLKVVPTSVTNRAGRTIRSFQYSARSEYETKEALAANKARRFPGVHFAYDFTPVMVHRKEESEGFLNFITSTSAIVGGVFTMSGLLVGFLQNIKRATKRD